MPGQKIPLYIWLILSVLALFFFLISAVAVLFFIHLVPSIFGQLVTYFVVLFPVLFCIGMIYSSISLLRDRAFFLSKTSPLIKILLIILISVIFYFWIGLQFILTSTVTSWKVNNHRLPYGMAGQPENESGVWTAVFRQPYNDLQSEVTAWGLIFIFGELH